MPHYRIWSLTDITLTPRKERAARHEFEQFKDVGDTGEWLDHYRTQPPSKYERSLAKRYRTAPEAKERLEVLEEWMLYLHRLFGQMTPHEQEIYNRRISSLLQIARAAVAREVRKTQLDMYEEPLGQIAKPNGKITVYTWTNDLTRVHEALKTAGIYSPKTEVSQIVDMYHIERPLKNVESSYRGSKAEIEESQTPSKKFLAFMKELARQLKPRALKELIDFCLDLQNKNPT